MTSFCAHLLQNSVLVDSPLYHYRRRWDISCPPDTWYRTYWNQSSMCHQDNPTPCQTYGIELKFRLHHTNIIHVLTPALLLLHAYAIASSLTLGPGTWSRQGRGCTPRHPGASIRRSHRLRSESSLSGRGTDSRQGRGCSWLPQRC